MSRSDADDSDSPEFRCAREGFEVAATGGLLGGFDGRDRRELHVYAVDERPAQLLVSMHEHLHHELQWSTTWGLVAAMSGLLSEYSDDERLRDVAKLANAASRRVHEVFATTISCGVLGVQTSRALLAGNRTYLDHLDCGLHLGGPSHRWPWQFRESAAQMLLRSLMQPAELGAVVAGGFEKVRVRDIASLRDAHPDQRLRKLLGETGLWWDDAFGELLHECPGRGGDQGDLWGRSLPADPAAMEELKAWEESVLIPRLQQVATARLRDHGFEILDGAQYLQAVEQLRTSFVRLGPPDWQVEVLTGMRPMSQEPLGAEREAIVLHAGPAQVAICNQDDLSAHSTQFLFRPADGPAHVLAVYLPRRTLMRQFAGTGDLGEHGPPILALAGQPTINDVGTRVAPLAYMRTDLKPIELVEMFTTLPAAVLTSLTTTREPASREQVLELPMAYVLIDLPLALQVAAWIGDGWTVRFRTVEIRGSLPLNLIIFALDGLADLWFLSYRSDAGFGELAQLLDRYRIVPGLELGGPTLAMIESITAWLMSAWWRIEEVEPQ